MFRSVSEVQYLLVSDGGVPQEKLDDTNGVSIDQCRLYEYLISLPLPATSGIFH